MLSETGIPLPHTSHDVRDRCVEALQRLPSVRGRCLGRCDGGGLASVIDDDHGPPRRTRDGGHGRPPDTLAHTLVVLCPPLVVDARGEQERRSEDQIFRPRTSTDAPLHHSIRAPPTRPAADHVDRRGPAPPAAGGRGGRRDAAPVSVANAMSERGHRAVDTAACCPRASTGTCPSTPPRHTPQGPTMAWGHPARPDTRGAPRW